MDEIKIKRILISVSDKTGLAELCKELLKFEVDIFASDGTNDFLMKNGVPGKSISSITNLSPMLDGRVKTLHPHIHAALLADKDNPEHLKTLENNDIKPFDMVIINFYPFEKVLNEKDANEDKIIENIDIGGPAMVRSSSKNFRSIAVITDSSQYKEIVDELKNNSGCISLRTRKKLAAEAFQKVTEYDSAISRYFNGEDKYLSIIVPKEYDLRYGENPHQKAALYGNFSDNFECIHGKELSYNNILDISAASDLIEEMDKYSCVIIKHNNPCGAATSDSVFSAYNNALRCDPKSAFGGIVCFNNPIDKETALKLNEIFTEIIILPEISNEIFEILKIKKDRRLIIKKSYLKREEKNLKSVPGGFLVQDKDNELWDESNFLTVTDIKPTDNELLDLRFAWIISKHVKSNAIVLAKDRMTLGIGAGQMSRVDSSKIAEMKAIEFNRDTNGCVIASDAFFPFADGLEVALRVGAKAVIQPGGSIRDKEVIEFANKNKIAMVFTGMRHFKH